MPAANHNKCIKTLKRRQAYLEERIANNTTDNPLTFDIAEVRALKYAIHMTEMCRSMLNAEERGHSS